MPKLPNGKLRLIQRRRTCPPPSMLFDPAYYTERNPVARQAKDPWRHFCQSGFVEGFDPHPLFSTRHYQQRHLDGNTSINPLTHYLEPQHHGCDPHPLFDSVAYQSQLDRAIEGVSPLEHFLVHNTSNQSSPSAFFDTRKYLSMYPEVGPAGIPGLYHFIRYGQSQGRYLSIDTALIEHLISRTERPDYDWLIDHWQADVRFLSAVLQLDQDRHIVALVASAGDYEWSNLLQRLSVYLTSNCQANVLHLFGGDPAEVEKYSPLGPTACWTNDSQGESDRNALEAIKQTVDQLGLAGAILVDDFQTETATCFQRLSCPKHWLFPGANRQVDGGAAEAIKKLSSHCHSVTVPVAGSLGQDSELATCSVIETSCDLQFLNAAADSCVSDSNEEAGLSIRETIGLVGGDKLLVGGGELNLACGFDRFVSVVLGWFAKRPSATDCFLWIGTLADVQQNELFQNLIEDLQQRGLDQRVYFLEQLEHQDAALCEADVVLQTHRRVSEGLSITRCLDAGRPIVWFAGHPMLENLLVDDPLCVRSCQAAEAIDYLERLTDDAGFAQQVSASHQQRRRQMTSIEGLVHPLVTQIEKARYENSEPESPAVDLKPFLKTAGRQRVIFTAPGWQISGVNTFIETLVTQLNEMGFDASVLFTTPQALTQHKNVLPNMPFRVLTQQEHLVPKRRRELLRNYLTLMAPCVFVPNYDYVASAVTPDLPENVATLGVLHSDDPAHYVHGYRMGPWWDAIVSVSDEIHENLLRLNPSFADRASVIRYGVPKPRQVIAPRSKNNDEKLRVIYTGRIVQRQKRVFDFVEVANRLDAHRDRFELVFVGDGPDYGEFRERIEPHIKTGLVHLEGRVKPHQVTQYLLNSHVFALTSEFEGLPLSMIEAMSVGLVPVVTSIASGIGEILDHRRNAMVSPIGQPDSLASNLLQLANNSEMFNRLSNAARHTYFDRKLTASDMAKGYAALLEPMFDRIQQAGNNRRDKLIYCPHIERMLNVA